MFTLCEGARLELPRGELALPPVEGFGQGGEHELSLLIQILAVTHLPICQFIFPGEPAEPFPASFTQGKFTGEMDRVGDDAFLLLHILSWGLLWL